MLQSMKDSIEPKTYKGEIEFIVKDKQGRVVQHIRQPNIIKIFAKEIFSHRIVHNKVWDPTANSSQGDWVTTGLNLDDFSIKYICFGASFDNNYASLDTSDSRFYTYDNITGSYNPKQLGNGAEYDGGLINPIPIAEPNRPLKRIERVFFEPSYQPAGTPLLQSDVRAVNNIVVFETVLRQNEYNGYGLLSDEFTITEVALVGAPEIGSVGSCDCDPHSLFLVGDTNGNPLPGVATGSATISLNDPTNIIREGDQVKITHVNGTDGSTSGDPVDQVTPYYLVLSKAGTGRDLVLDRTPVDVNGDPIPLNYPVGVVRDDFRIFSHRILKVPLRKTSDYEVTCRWSLILN
jgi:hypothetical protein